MVQKRQQRNLFLIFSLGASLYSLIETLWRGYTHWTMALTGGACLSTFYSLLPRLRRTNLLKKCAVGSAVITGFELAVGAVVNLWLQWQVWDYSSLPFHFKGQICLLFSFLWFLLSAPAFWLCTYLEKKLQ